MFSSLSSLQRRIPSGVLIASFGLLLTAAAWLDVLHRESTDRAAEIERIHRENGALARAFEEHVRRVVQSADNALKFLQAEYESLRPGDPGDPQLRRTDQARSDPQPDLGGGPRREPGPERGPARQADHHCAA